MAKIGTVQFIAGVVKAISVSGQERILHVGDKVHPNEKLSTGDESSVVLVFDDGTRLDLGRNSQMILNENTVTPEKDTSQIQASTSDQTQQTAQNEVDALQKALQDENFDPTKALPATAAGAGAATGGVAGGANNGHTFVVVDYLNPQMAPDSGFDTRGISYAAAQVPLEVLLLTPIGPTPNQNIPSVAPSVVSVEPANPTVPEGTSLVYNVTLSASPTVSTNYPFALGGGTASPSDYTNTPSFTNGVTYDSVTQTITVPAGVTGFSVTVPTVDDTLVEGTTPETLPLSIGGVTGIGGIEDNDSPAISSVKPAADTVIEGNPLTYNVTLSEVTVKPTSYPFALGGGTASPSDYTNTPSFTNGVTYDPVTQTITVPAGVTGFSVTVPTIDDTLVEGTTPETLPLSIGGVTGVGGIIDNDYVNIPPTVDLDANNSNNTIITQQIAGLFNTGVDNNHNRLANGVVDPHYTLLSQPAGGSVANVTTQLSYAWLATDTNSTSDWIGSINNERSGLYTFQTSFDLSASVNPATTHISFDIAFDNTLRDILVNGVSTGLGLTGNGAGYGFNQYTHVELNGATGLFSNAHTNTITFLVENRDQVYQAYSGPTGIRIDNMHATVMAVGTDLINHQADFAVFYKDAPISIADTDVIVKDVDNTLIQSATITLTNQQIGDVLAISSNFPANIAATISGNVVKLVGAASFADYQQAIKSIQFNNTNPHPNSTVDRLITVVVNDGKADSNIATTTIHVIGSPYVPVLDLNSNVNGTGYNTVYAAQAAGVALGAASTLLTDINAMVFGTASIHIVNVAPGDILSSPALPAGIHASIYDPTTGTLNLSGNGSLVDYQNAIRNVSFSNNTATPDLSQRSIEITFNDGENKSNIATTTVDITNNTITGTNLDNTLLGTTANDAINGNGGNDNLSGQVGNDVLNGGEGNDTLNGGIGNDILVGGNGDDILIGGAGNDTLTGGAGSDSFVWNHGETGKDIISDFTAGKGGDVLNLADLLQDEHSNSGSLSSFLSFSYDTTNKETTITIDADKVGQGSAQTQTIVMQNVDLTASGTLSNVQIINSLLENGNIQTDA